ncbi:MAG: hypothetical protein AB7I27_18190 [Bacteriovoracaceae bacterium]
MKWFFILFSLFSYSAMAFDNPYYMRSPTALLMGDAFTAVNDDEYTLFYNPASLARHKNDLTLTPLNPQGSGTNVLNDLDKFKDFPSDAVGASEVLMDYPVHASAGISPGFKFFNFGVTFIANESYDILLRNKAHPMLDLDLRSDRGVMFGVGIPLGGNLSKKTQSGSKTSMGLSVKRISRTGLRDSLALTGPTVVDSLSKEDVSQIVNSLGQASGKAWGFDFGLEHMMKSGPNQFVIGLSALDIGGTKFKVADNPNDLKVADTKGQVNLGLAGGQDFGLFHYILSTDFRGLNEQMDFGKRVRLGAQVGIPLLTFMGGINSGYYSYGASLNLGLMKLTGGLYDVEIGSKYKQIRSKQFIIYLSLFDFSFDA